jgi:hypothetical protein
MPWTADGKWIPEDDSVAARLTGLLANGGTYLNTARAAGVRTAARRGLLNSSIAAGSGESAAIAAAAPIASQDSQQIFQRNQAVLEGGINLNNQTTLQAQQISGQKDLNSQQYGFQTNLNAQQNTAQMDRDRFAADAQMQRDKFAQEGATEQQLREFDQRTAEQVRNLDAEALKTTQTLSSNERTAAMSADTNVLQTQIQANSQLSSQYLNAFSNLASDPNIPADVRNSYIAEFRRVMEQGQALIGAVQKVPLSWGGGATATTPTTPTPAATPAPASTPAYTPPAEADNSEVIQLPNGQWYRFDRNSGQYSTI